jgi:Ser/Thr protein kinase RdoA (MazF antagonist)
LIPAFGGSIPPAPANLPHIYRKRILPVSNGLPHDLDLASVAERALPHYGLTQVVALALVNLSENATFKVERSDGACFALRVHREGYHSKAAIASELAWLIDLRQTTGVTTPRPIAGLNGELIQEVASRHVVMFEWESGREPGIGEDLEKPFEALGEAAARMHNHVLTWQKPEGFTRHTWNFETAIGDAKPHWGRWRDGIGVDDQMRHIFTRSVAVIGKRLAAYGMGKERFGLVHGDLRLANLLLDGDEVKVIDFDDCGFSWFMYDAATPVSFYEHEPHVLELIERWKAGYRRVRVLRPEDEQEIPTFVMLRRLLLVAWIGSRRDTDLAKSMGVQYSLGTVDLCERYLKTFG